MHIKKQLALLVVVIVAGFGVMTAAQAKKGSAKTAAKRLRVFFVEPKNNATVSSPLHMKFGSEGIEISPVPPGDLTKTRPGVGHYHVGIEQACLPAGKTIVKGTPSWVHFGKGESEFDTQLSPGKHKLSVQLGDDLHNTIAGACSTVNVTVK